MNQYLPDNLSGPLPDLQQIDELLFESVVKRRSPEKTVNALYEIIRRPIIAFDTAFHLIAYAFPRPFLFAPWEEIASTGNLSDRYIYENNALFSQELMYRHRSSSLFDTGTALAQPQVCGPILTHGRLLGYAGICISTDNEISRLIYINDHLAEALALGIASSSSGSGSYGQETSFEQFFCLGTAVDGATEKWVAKHPASYLLAVLTPLSGQAPTLQYIRSRIESGSFPVCAYIDRNEQIVILFYNISMDNSADIVQEIQHFLMECSERYQAVCGVSDLFHQQDFIPVARLQAEISVRAGKRLSDGRNTFSFRALYERILCSHALERYGRDLCLPPFLRNCGQGKTDRILALLPTIETFLASGGSRERTAEQLGIHKNTVNYRVQRFMDLTGSDPQDPSIALQIRVGLMLMRHSDELSEGISAQLSGAPADETTAMVSGESSDRTPE